MRFPQQNQAETLEKTGYLCQKKDGPSGATNAIPALDITNLYRRSEHAR